MFLLPSVFIRFFVFYSVFVSLPFLLYFTFVFPSWLFVLVFSFFVNSFTFIFLFFDVSVPSFLSFFCPTFAYLTYSFSSQTTNTVKINIFLAFESCIIIKGRDLEKKRTVGTTLRSSKLDCIAPNGLPKFLKLSCAQEIHTGISHCFKHEQIK
jgi:hypothetical protein